MKRIAISVIGSSPSPIEAGPARPYHRPVSRITVPSADEKPLALKEGQRIYFVRRDAMHRHLGEKFAVQVEKRRLLFHDGDDLAARGERVAVTCSDGIGFDVLSFDEGDDSEWWIEVKTTGLGKHFPFYVSANEVRCSEDCPDRFRLYRLFNFVRNPRIYVVGGSLSKKSNQEPVEFRASV